MIAERIRDAWPHRMSGAAAEVINRHYLRDMAAEVREVNTANGWFDDDRRPAEGLALLHSEVSEWLEALRSWGTADATKDERVPCHDPQCGDSTWDHDCTETTKPGKPEGVGSEAADVLIRLLDECDRQGIDLIAEYERKIAYNRTRGYKHGGRAL